MIELSSAKNQSPTLLGDLLVVLLAEGRLRLPRWLFSYSTSLALTGLMIQTRRGWLAKFLFFFFQTLAHAVCVPTAMEQTPNHYDTTHDLLIPHPNPDTKLAHAGTLCPTFYPPHPALRFIQKKIQFHWFKAEFKIEWQLRETCREEEVCAESENCHTWQPPKRC